MFSDAAVRSEVSREIRSNRPSAPYATELLIKSGATSGTLGQLAKEAQRSMERRHPAAQDVRGQLNTIAVWCDLAADRRK